MDSRTSLIRCKFHETGTGKTMSVICSALQWVLDRRREQELAASSKNQENQGGVGSDDEPDWMRDFVVDKENLGQPERIVKKKEKYGSGLGKPGKKNGGICKDFQVVGQDSLPKKKCENLHKRIDEVDIEKEFLLDDYESEDEEGQGNMTMTSKRKATKSAFTSSSEEDESDKEQEQEQEEKKWKVYFCSRTHSQLSQFIKELQKTVFASEMDVICLGSRKNLCINEGLKYTY